MNYTLIIVLYYNIDIIIKHLYLPYTNQYNNELISSNEGLCFLLNTTSCFMFFLYSYTLLYGLFISKIIDKPSIILMFIYLKHLIDVFFIKDITIIEYEISRGLMWTFTTPLMLKMYCDTNDFTLKDINIHYHIIAIVSHNFFIPLKHNYKKIYFYSVYVCFIPELLFLKTLYSYRNLPFTNVFILIWAIFLFINMLDMSGLFNPIFIHGLYNLADTLCKFVCNVVISNYNEQEIIFRDNMDLQSVDFATHVIKTITYYENENKNITPFCNKIIKYSKKKFMNKIPKTDERLKLELLKKILPFDLDTNYINKSLSERDNEIPSGSNIKFTNICILFVDIINYTEIAKKYNGDIIFKLLNNIYIRYDNIIKNYKRLQKIETIGDAYMVVGDIYRREPNHILVIKDIILLGMEFIKDIKNIKTPDEVPLSIRIGINMGSVNIGILGNEIPRLCVVGNTVNVASRLQTTAEEDTIQISNHIYENIKKNDMKLDINFIKKENVFLKNIGSVTTYNIKSSYSY